MGVRVVTDTSCDLPREVLDRLQITTVPLVVIIGTEAHADGELSLDEYWRRVEVGDQPQTSQPSLGSYEAAYERLTNEGHQVICITVTGEHSGTYSTAALAAERFGGQVTVFDSRSLSLGLGFQVQAAAEAAQKGHPLSAITAMLTTMRERVDVTIVLETLESLRRGGRASAFIAAAERMARILDVKVIINTVDGRLRPLTAARSAKAALARALKLVEGKGPLEKLGVIHARSRERAAEVADQLAARLGIPREEIPIAETGPALASHSGPGAIGLVTVVRPAQRGSASV
ncbi:MAG: DegV family protein [Anaerolineales bacterium]|nr:DegV family protein [Anaerolineales bacterium]